MEKLNRYNESLLRTYRRINLLLKSGVPKALNCHALISLGSSLASWYYYTIRNGYRVH